VTHERARLRDARDKGIAWRKWGPYLSERQWGTVREDYSENGDAWNHFTHDQSRSRAYRWGEDGIAGVSDDQQRLCFAVALWNGKDPILKERLFGLANSEGNHGEDVKEAYWYLDNVPSHAYMKYLYKYPHAAFPYDNLVKTNAARGKHEPEYELLDTGIFDANRYFDVFVEYAKASPDDLLIRIRVANRGPERAALHVLPHLWFRNTWSWGDAGEKPVLEQAKLRGKRTGVVARHPELATRWLLCAGAVPLLFTENETNRARIFGEKGAKGFFKDGINDAVVDGKRDRVSPEPRGTKVAFDVELDVAPGGMQEIRLRLTDQPPGGAKAADPLGREFESVFRAREDDADEFYAELTASAASPDAARVQRQALAGMLWSKQYYYFDVNRWLEEHQAHPLAPRPKEARNRGWPHLLNADIISMPDKWEYPWYAAWDLAFHAVAFSELDPDFAVNQLKLMLEGNYLHPSGQIPAYEWNFGDVNPPVHAWATLFMLKTQRALGDHVDVELLKSAYQKLLLNFTWWVNRKDRTGRNVFEGGFLGLDNIGIFDRSAPLPTGGSLEQADGTGWMALFSQNMLELSIELAGHDRVYQDFAAKFVDHFLWIAHAMNRKGDDGMWDEEDGFYYDVLRLPDGSARRLKVRSLVGLLPLCAATVIEPWHRDRIGGVMEVIYARAKQMPDLLKSIHPTGPGHLGVNERGILALLDPAKLRRVLSRVLDESEFLSPYGIRSVSKFHERNPYVFSWGGTDYRVGYNPAESDNGAFGGNSNWRGPVWFPINVLIIRALLTYYLYHGDGFKIECPTGSGKKMNLYEVAHELERRLGALFLRGKDGRRPVFGGQRKMQEDPHWRDHLLFYEYFHGDDGAGIGASHQTGWTGIVARLMQLFERNDAKRMLTTVRQAAAGARKRGASAPPS